MIITLLTLLFTVGNQQSDSLFDMAIKDQSTAPYFVVITVVDDSAKTSRAICTTANLLLGAIHIEQGLDYDDASEKKALKIALSNKTRTFHFLKREALNNIPVEYGPELLDSVREKIHKIPVAAIRRQLRDMNGFRSIPEVRTHRNAVAHVFVEMGFAIREDCRTGAIISGK